LYDEIHRAMNERELVKTSKFLSLILRHQPETVGLKLDAAGWVEVDVLLAACSKHRKPIARELLDRVVAENNKKRFAFSEDGLRIRASQGHSIDVELGYEAADPPATLFHGTAERNLAPIQAQGLLKQQRHHVHLTADRETALNVGRRHGKPALLIVAAQRMVEDGHQFFISANGVWLTETVPQEYLSTEND
jgi:putative RNA 2'-phosphotransferase